MSSAALSTAPDPRSADPVLKQQLWGVLFSAGTYVVYSGILGTQVALGLAAGLPALGLMAAALLVNLGFYAWVRSGRARRGPDPGLARGQLIVGVLFLYAAYAISGLAAPSMTIIMASHVVYAMFAMRPRDVWRLVAAALAGLALTMLGCHLAWPARYPAGLQAVAWLYAALVVPLIATLADRVTAMTQKLKSQRRELEQALAQVRELATRDELTRTHSRAHMGELIRLQHEQHRRSGAPLSLALVDIDHFKQVNDRHGHAVGDEVLRRFARRAQAQLRAGDLLGRWGGEEFLLLLPGTPAAEAVQALERLQQTLAEPAAAEHGMPHQLHISFSAGVTELEPEDSMDRAIDRADQAMYRAKNAGRARCETA
jgi:diguanylate cyclase (GGDEF)-like protein